MPDSLDQEAQEAQEAWHRKFGPNAVAYKAFWCEAYIAGAEAHSRWTQAEIDAAYVLADRQLASEQIARLEARAAEDASTIKAMQKKIDRLRRVMQAGEAAYSVRYWAPLGVALDSLLPGDLEEEL